MKKLNSIVNRLKGFYISPRHFVSGALALSLFHLPFMPLSLKPVDIGLGGNPVVMPATATVSAETVTDLESQFFGHVSSASKAKIDEEVAFVSSRDAFPASLAVIEKHAATIKSVARGKGVPEDVAIGVALLENGGSETAVSSAGAMGVFQLMPGTARNLGLTVTKKVDERRNPEKNIEAGISYLAHNYEVFGDWGLATWAYHAGEGNVSKALKIYAKNHGSRTPTVNELLSDPAVREFTKKLHDDSAGYPYKVVATAKIFRSSH